jgi:3-deoxy-D-manno-octulosonic-acid transferase
MWLVYELLLILAFLLYLPKALWRRRLPHRGWSMRFGRYPAQVRERLSGRESLWVHAVSVGEVLAARPLLQALSTAYPQHPLVLSTVTVGGFEVASKQAADQGAAIYVPLDLRPCVRRSLDLGGH